MRKAKRTGDIVSQEVRSRMMRAVRQRDTRLEIAVRRVLRTMGVFYRVSNRDLPGSPDVANRRNRWTIFINGCFWHGHSNCPKTKSGKGGRIPASNHLYWAEKIRSNRQRDGKKKRALRRLGFRVLVIWECEMRDSRKLESRLSDFFEEIRFC